MRDGVWKKLMGLFRRSQPPDTGRNIVGNQPFDTGQSTASSQSSDVGQNVAEILARVYESQNPFGFDVTEDFEGVAKTILGEYTSRHFAQGSDESVVAHLKYFLTNKTISRGFFVEQPHLATAARILIACKDNPEIREWSVDLLGRTGGAEDVALIVDMANNDENATVRQEATAALTKFVRFKDAGHEIVDEIKLEREEDNEKVLKARSYLNEAINSCREKGE